MYDPEAEAREWREDAERDYRDAEKAIEDGNYIRACFYCHQAAEKIIKALHHFKGGIVRGHNLVRLLRGLTRYGIEVSDLLEDAERLNPHYSATRYPNARRIAGLTVEDYSEELAKDCFGGMERIWRRVSGYLTLE